MIQNEIKINLFGLEFSIYWYGIMIALGIILCFVTLFLYCKFKKVEERFTDFCFYTAVAAIACGIGGAALFQSVYNYIANPSAGFRIGGLTFIGGLICGVGFFLIIYFIFRKKYNDTLLKIMPIVGSCVTIAHGMGRIGCFFAGCCYGKETDSIFGVHFPHGAASTLDKVHPTQLYEAIFLLVLFAVLTFLAFKCEFKYNMSIYLVAYGIFRFINEYFRGDARGELLGFMTPSQFWSVVMVCIGILYIFAIKKDWFGKIARHFDIKDNNNRVKNKPQAKEEPASSPVDTTNVTTEEVNDK